MRDRHDLKTLRETLVSTHAGKPIPRIIEPFV